MTQRPTPPHTAPEHPPLRSPSGPGDRLGMGICAGKRAVLNLFMGVATAVLSGGWAGAQPATALNAPSGPTARPNATPLLKPPAFTETFATPALIRRLRQGGYVLYMRHGNTNNEFPDQPDMTLDDCSTQRPLNAQGREVATAVGKAVVKARIPVGDVWASPMCRAKESAQLAFGPKTQVDKLLMYTANLTTAQKQPMLANTRRLLSEPVATGTNRVVVAHAPNLADLMGFFVKPEGTIVVISPLGNQQFRYVASIHPQHWPDLLK